MVVGGLVYCLSELLLIMMCFIQFVLNYHYHKTHSPPPLKKTPIPSMTCYKAPSISSIKEKLKENTKIIPAFTFVINKNNLSLVH